MIIKAIEQGKGKQNKTPHNMGIKSWNTLDDIECWINFKWAWLRQERREFSGSTNQSSHPLKNQNVKAREEGGAEERKIMMERTIENTASILYWGTTNKATGGNILFCYVDGSACVGVVRVKTVNLVSLTSTHLYLAFRVRVFSTEYSFSYLLNIYDDL